MTSNRVASPHDGAWSRDEPKRLAPIMLDERRAADSLVTKATNIRRALNSPTLHARQACKGELKKLIAEARDLWSTL